MIVTTMKPREITADQRRRALNFVNCGSSIRQAAALSGASIADVTAWRDEAAQRKAPVTGDGAATPELRQATRRGRKGPRKPVYVDGMRLGRLALWSSELPGAGKFQTCGTSRNVMASGVESSATHPKFAITMFVQFRSSPKRLHLSLVASHRVGGRMTQEHIAALGSIPIPFNTTERVVFWRKAIERLDRLSNRLDAETHAAIVDSIATRVPLIGEEDVRAVQMANAEREAEAFKALRELAAGDVELFEKQAREKRATHKAISKVVDNAARATERLKAGETVGGYLDKPK